METITVKAKKPSFIGFAAFMIVLFTMPLGHAAMIIMEKTLGESYLTPAAFLLGLVGAALAVWGFYMKNEVTIYDNTLNLFCYLIYNN